MWSRHLFALGLSFCLSVPLWAQDFQSVIPSEDATFVEELGLYRFSESLPAYFNILIVGQDNSTNRRKRDERLLLGSRVDIIMVLSINTQSGESQIFSIHRGNTPDGQCVQKLGYTPSGSLINEVYRAGRRQFIPCLEGVLARRLALLPGGDEFLNEQGEFEIHAFFEGTRNNTIGPVARESVDVVSQNLSTFAWLYGAKSIAAAFDLLKNGSDLQAALEEPAMDEALQDQLEEVDTEELSDYLIVELKERDAYKAAGYQRAFNFAAVVATALGWSAYGIHHRESQDHQFLGQFFGEVIDRNFSASHFFT